MRRIFALALALSAPAFAAGPEPRTDRLEADARGTLIIEPDGRVSEVTLPDALEEPLRGLFADAIKAWTFEPVTVDGQVVRAVAHMDLDLYITVRGKDLVGAGIERVVFIDPPAVGEAAASERASMRPPRFPESLAARGIGGRVLLKVQTDAAGRVERVATRDGALFVLRERTTEREIQRAFNQLAETSERAVSRWVMPNCPDSCLVPIHFTIANKFWRPVLNVAHTPPAWVFEGDAPKTLTAGGGLPSQRFRLITPFEGIELLPSDG